MGEPQTDDSTWSIYLSVSSLLLSPFALLLHVFFFQFLVVLTDIHKLTLDVQSAERFPSIYM